MAPLKNPISLLQELSVQEFKRIPEYTFEEIRTQEFKCIVSLCTFSVEATAQGKKAAKTQAAESMLQLLGVSLDTASSKLSGKQNRNCSSSIMPSFAYSKLSQNFLNTQNGTNDKMETLSSSSVTSELRQTSNVSKASSLILDNGTKISNDNSSVHQKSHHTLEEIGSDYIKNLVNQTSIPSPGSSGTSHSSQYQSIDEEDFPMEDEISNNSCDTDLYHSSVTRNSPVQEFLSNSSITDNKKSSSPSENFSVNPVSYLEEKLLEMNVLPEYAEVCVTEHGTNSPTYYYEVSAVDESAVGSGSSKKEAKANAALSLMTIMGIEFKENTGSVEPSTSEANDNVIGKLMTYCQNHFIKDVPVYECLKSEGDPHCKIFTMRCTVGSIFVDQSAKNKKLAKKLCAQAILDNLEQSSSKSKIKEISFVSQLNDDSIHERVWKRLDETGARNEIKLNAAIDQVPLKDYLYLFEKNFYGKSETLQKLKALTMEELYSLPNPGNIFRDIVNELSIVYELSKMDSKRGVVLNLLLKCQPNWSFLECGDSLEGVKRRIFISALEFFCSM